MVEAKMPSKWLRRKESAAFCACCSPSGVSSGPGTEVSLNPDALPCDCACRTKVNVIDGACGGGPEHAPTTVAATRAAIAFPTIGVKRGIYSRLPTNPSWVTVHT